MKTSLQLVILLLNVPLICHENSFFIIKNNYPLFIPILWTIHIENLAKQHGTICVCFWWPFTHLRLLGPTLEVRVWPIFFFCTSLAGQVTVWCISVSLKRCKIWVLYWSVMYEWWMWGEEGWRWNLGSVLAYSYWKVSKRLSSLMSPSCGSIAKYENKGNNNKT